MKEGGMYDISSEDIEPSASFVISRMFFQAQEKKDTIEYEDCLKRLWCVVRSFNRIAGSIRGNLPMDGHQCAHFSVAMGNELGRICNFIEQELKLDPFKEWGEL